MTVLAVTTRYRELCWNLSTSWTVSILEVRFWKGYSVVLRNEIPGSEISV